MILAARQRRFYDGVRKASHFLLVGSLLFVSSCFKTSENPSEFAGFALGTTYSIKVSQIPPGSSKEKLHAGIKSLLEEVESSMSVFNPGSELSRFNLAISTDWFDISKDLFTVVSEARNISEISSGAFDITLGDLIELWGFGKAVRPQTVPSPEDILNALKNSGYRNLELSLEKTSLRKSIPSLKLNLSAIAKGFAVDQVALFLEQMKIENYLVEIGGEIRTHGEKQEGKPWIVAIERPELDKRSIFKVVRLGNASMATSGDYRNFYEIEGTRYSHTIDPENGRPSANNIASVSVLHPSCMTADALATALVVMGYEKGYRFANTGGFAVLWILRTENGLIEKATSEFATNISF